MCSRPSADSFLMKAFALLIVGATLAACAPKEMRFVALSGQPGAGAAITFTGNEGVLEVTADSGLPARSTKLSGIDYPNYWLFPPQGVTVSMTLEDTGQTMKFTAIDKNLLLQSGSLYNLPERWRKLDKGENKGE